MGAGAGAGAGVAGTIPLMAALVDRSRGAGRECLDVGEAVPFLRA